MKKRIVSLLLAAVLVIGLVPMAGAYSDVADSQLSARLELLSGLGVVNGYTDGTFKPQNTLTRAEFTKMVVMLLGGDKTCETFGAYTIFGDVPSSGWSAKFINYAARDKEKGGLGLLKGYTDGTFKPNNTITYGEAATIILRALGYTDADVGFTWPKNFTDKAASSGLGDRVSRGDYEAISRADAANIFYNALFVEKKDGSKLIDNMYGESISSALILSVDSDGVRIAERPDDRFTNAAGLTAEDVGTRKKLTLNENATAIMYAEKVKMTTSEKQDAFIYSVKTEDGLCYVSLDGSTEVLCLAPVDEGWIARSAKLTVDSASGAIVKAELLESRNRTVSFAYYSGDRVTAITGEVFTVPANTPTYKVENGEMSASQAFSAVRDHLSYGDVLELTLGSDGTVKHVVARTGEAKVALIEPGTTLTALREALGAPEGVTIYKNGAETSFSALADYDAASYIPGSSVIMVGGFRLSAVYTYAVPNTTAPESITVYGNTLRLAPCAVKSVSQFKPNERLTLIFAPDGRVAGALEGGSQRSVGVVDGSKVKFLGGPTLSIPTDGAADGELVSVACGSKGQPSVSRVSDRATNSALDLDALTLGGTPLAVGCMFFERVGGQTPVSITREDINRTRIPASSILNVTYDEAGRANLIVFDDVTGDRFSYGRAWMYVEEETIGGGTLSVSYDRRHIVLTGSKGADDGKVAQTAFLPSDLRASEKNATYGRRYFWCGVATGASGEIEKYKALDVSYAADRTTFVGSTAVKVGGKNVPIASGVQVYLESTEVFMNSSDFESTLELVSAARAQGEKFELLLDAAPENGGKVRVIVVK